MPRVKSMQVLCSGLATAISKKRKIGGEKKSRRTKRPKLSSKTRKELILTITFRKSIQISTKTNRRKIVRKKHIAKNKINLKKSSNKKRASIKVPKSKMLTKV